jgi:signal transduction histidine kinase
MNSLSHDETEIEQNNISAGNEKPDKDNYATLLKIGRLFSHPLITTVVSVFASVVIYVALHLLFSKPFIIYEMTLPVIIPTLVAYPISKMFQFFTQELERSNRSLSEANQEIIAQKAELEELNKIKLKLFSIIAHDLRSPVALLYSYMQVLQEEGLDSNEMWDMMPAISEQIKSTLQLMDNLLQWSNTQMDGINPSISTIDITELLSENAELFKVQLEKKNITLHIENTCSEKIPADQNMLRLVLRNLTGNAVKFTPQAGKIEITAKDDIDQLYLTVQDSGIGISPADQQKLFRTDLHHTTTGTNNERGTGLGLLLCKQFIEKHHGQIQLESEVGQGSKFTVMLPKNSASQPLQ